MVNTRLVMALEELFKKEPFNYENDIFIITAERGRIKVEEHDINEATNDFEIEITELENELSGKDWEVEEAESDARRYKNRVEYLESVLDENEIDYNE